MDFRVNDDQRALQEGIRSFCQGRADVDALRVLEKSDGFDPNLWRELAEMGAFSLRLPESQDGVGLGMAEAVLVFEELGRAVVPGPIVWSHLAAGLVAGAADGSRVVGGLDLLDGHGEPFLVEHLDRLDDLVVLRRDGVFLVDPDALAAVRVGTPLDPLTPLFEIDALPAGKRIGDAEAAARLRLEGAVLSSGMLLGIAEATLDLANAYAKEREQFGRTIGSFQAIKHILADCFVRQEAARAAVYAAGATWDDPSVGDVARAVRGAKLTAADAAMKNSRACIQVHGGMGFTWEVPAHYYWKRAWVLENAFGTVDELADALAATPAAAAH